MGMYTLLEFQCELSTFGLEVVEHLHHESNSGSWFGVFCRWPDVGFIAQWNKVGRKNFIPFGVSAYFDTTGSHLEGNVWNVSCSLKNYEEEIEIFLAVVLPNLIEKECRVLYRYEELEEDEATRVIVVPSWE